MSKPMRVLHRVGALNFGGLESVVVNYYRHIDKTKVQFDFIYGGGNGRYVKEILEAGGKIFATGSRFRHPVAYYKQIKEMLLTGKYDVVHLHNNSASIAFEALICKRMKVPHVIVHSHSNGCKYKMQHYVFKLFLNKLTDYFFGCSTGALEWMFGKKMALKEGVVLKNAIEVNAFAYDPDKRDAIRKELNLEGKFVIGNVSGLKKEKNHNFIIDVFKKVLEQKPEAFLVLVGDGELRVEIEKRVKDEGLENCVKLLGNRPDANNFYQAFDVFLLPSKFEGLGIVNIEAQVAGLKCFVSDVVPEEAKISELLEFLSLKDGEDFWAQKIIEFSNENTERRAYTVEAKNAGYDIENEAKWMENFYLELNEC